jgi:hypothetical protein
LLTRIESFAFESSSLRSIVILCHIEIFYSKCFAFRESLVSISFESESSLWCIESSAFESSSLRSILIPNHVEIFVRKVAHL